MTENECIEILKNNFPKTCKMVDGRYKGGFDDTECEFGQALLLSISALEEIHQYRTIGTVEECWEAREKQRGKKPVLYKDTNRADCPVCGNTVRSISKPFGDWCSHCGYKLDWSE